MMELGVVGGAVGNQDQEFLGTNDVVVAIAWPIRKSIFL